MPFWSNKTNRSQSSVDQHPRPSSRLDVYYPRQHPPAPEYDPYRHDSRDDLRAYDDWRAVRAGTPPISLIVPEHTGNTQRRGPQPHSYESSPVSPDGSNGDKRISLRSKLGIGYKSREEVQEGQAEGSGKRSFGRSRSLRRKERPPSQIYQQEPQLPVLTGYIPVLPLSTVKGSGGEVVQHSYQNINIATAAWRPLPAGGTTGYEEISSSSPYSTSRQPLYQPYHTQPNDVISSSFPHTQQAITASLDHLNQQQLIQGGSRPSSRQQTYDLHLEATEQTGAQEYKPRPEPPNRQASSPSQLGLINMVPPTGPRQQRQAQAQSLDFGKLTNPGTTSQESSSLQPPREASELASPPTPGLTPNPSSGPPTGSQRGQSYQAAYESEPGRRTPPPMRAPSEMSVQEVTQLIRDHKELKEKYSKVKKYYFEKDDQVRQLQNTLANQRLSLSRTSLDDSEYVARLTRLDGLIGQLAYGFRKDWKTIPVWLQPHVNKDAIVTGKQEMTAVGRAYISRWLADEVFGKHFHPGLDIGLSTELRTVQTNVRKSTPTHQSKEEEEALTAKLIGWRLTTMDGLQQILAGPKASIRQQHLVQTLDKDLLSAICEYLQDPPPSGLEGGVHMIIELVVGLLSHLPLESRDVHIEYFHPGHAILPDLMKVETGIQPLVSPIMAVESPEGDKASLTSEVSDLKDVFMDSREEETEPSNHKDQDHGKKSFLGGLIGGKKSTASSQLQKQGNATGSHTSLVPLPPLATATSLKEEAPPRVRLCVFLGVQIRGKTVLIKAPVFKT